MHFEDLFAAFKVGQADDDLTVETTRTQQRGVKDVRAVGRSDDDNAFITFEAVHFHEQLVQGLFAFVVSATETGATLAADGVDFVDEDDARRFGFGFFKHVAYTRGTNTDEHFDEVRTGDGEERHFCFAGNRAGEQGFTGAGRANHQQAARDLSAQAAEFAGVTQEFDHFFHVGLGFVRPGHVGKGDFDFVFRNEAGAAFAEGEGAALAAALHLPGGEHEQADEQQDGQEIDEDTGQQALFFQRFTADVHFGSAQVANEGAGIRRFGVVGSVTRAATVGEGDARVLQVDRCALHFAVINAVEELRVANFARAAGGAEFAHLADEH